MARNNRADLIVLVWIVLFGRSLRDVETRYGICMDDAGFSAYSEAIVSSPSEGIVVLRIVKPHPEADTPQFMTQSEACLAEVNSRGRYELQIVGPIRE